MSKTSSMDFLGDQFCEKLRCRLLLLKNTHDSFPPFMVDGDCKDHCLNFTILLLFVAFAVAHTKFHLPGDRENPSQLRIFYHIWAETVQAMNRCTNKLLADKHKSCIPFILLIFFLYIVYMCYWLSLMDSNPCISF